MTVKNEAQYTVLLGGPYNQLDFTEFDGGQPTREVQKYPLGLKDEMGSVVGLVAVSDITLRTPYDPSIHDEVMQTWLNYCGEPIDIVVQPMKVCPEMTEDGKQRVYTGCVPAALKPPGVKRGGSGVSMLEMTFAVQNMKIG
jgi:hypothetical protein